MNYSPTVHVGWCLVPGKRSLHIRFPTGMSNSSVVILMIESVLRRACVHRATNVLIDAADDNEALAM